VLGLAVDPEAGPWEMPILPEGHVLGEPRPLFRKLDESLIEEERARLG